MLTNTPAGLDVISKSGFDFVCIDLEHSSISYEDLEQEWSVTTNEVFDQITQLGEVNNNQKLTISSICLVIGLPKETVRRKINELSKKKF